jgi:hypothetical protein
LLAALRTNEIGAIRAAVAIVVNRGVCTHVAAGTEPTLMVIGLAERLMGASFDGDGDGGSESIASASTKRDVSRVSANGHANGLTRVLVAVHKQPELGVQTPESYMLFDGPGGDGDDIHPTARGFSR